MPELPEVETTIRYLSSKVKGKKILQINKSDKKLRKNLTLKDLSSIHNQKIINIKRIAKYIVIELSGGIYLIIHLGMSGRLKFLPKSYSGEKHDHLRLTFSDFLVVFNDPRRFGMTFLLTNLEMVDQFFNHYGCDPLQDKLKIKQIYTNISNKNISVKQFLLDQKYFVGIGNIYANEILFLSLILPTRPVRSLNYEEFMKLVKCIKKILIIAIKKGGSSINDYKAPDGVLGSFQNFFKVYQKETIKIQNKTYLVKKITQNGRSTFYCPALQI